MLIGIRSSLNIPIIALAPFTYEKDTALPRCPLTNRADYQFTKLRFIASASTAAFSTVMRSRDL